MKKILLGLSLLFIATTNLWAVEIIPEYYLMERLLLPIEKSEVYVNQANGTEVKAIQVNSEVIKKLNTEENPFYVYDSTGKEKLVRKGDYFLSPLRLPSIYVISKDKFEENFRSKLNPEKSLNTQIDTKDNENINASDVDAGTMDIQETAQ